METHQDALLLQLRPIIDIEFYADKTDQEKFMHETLRAILKLQHDKIIQIIEDEPHFKKNTLLEKQTKDQSKWMKDYLTKNPTLKMKLLGIIIGMMTQEEFEFYLLNQTNLNNRINEMIVVRYISSIDK